MQQVVVIHGGDSFATYEDYITFLKEFEIDFERSGKGWKALLGETLGESYTIISPSMPNKQNAKYEEWKIWFEKYIPILKDDVVLIGHSLGGSFLSKYLSEERLPIRIRATFIIAAPYDEDDGRKLVEFTPPNSLKLLEEQGGEVFLYHSSDDPIVDFSELSKYTQRLPQAHPRIFTDRGHFIQEEFPELVKDIRSLA